jgi:general secretion pathway protein B
MSFILDALKKSESDRQRQSGPALFEVKVAPPRTRLPPWAFAIAALLVVNLVIVMWMLMRHPSRGALPVAASGQTAPPGVPAPATPAPSLSARPAGAAPGPAPGGTGAPAPPPAIAATAATAAPPVTPASAPAPAVGATAPEATTPSTAAAPAAAEAPAAGAANPEDYAPAEEPAAADGFAGRVRRGTASGVPLYQDAAATAGAPLPQLRLDLHVFATRPQDRFVMINMHKLREGESLPEGVRVESITPEGAVLSYNGSRFLLPRE